MPTANKAEAVFHTMFDAVSEKVPATILRRHPHAVMFTDEDSAKALLKAQ